MDEVGKNSVSSEGEIVGLVIFKLQADAPGLDVTTVRLWCDTQPLHVTFSPQLAEAASAD